MFSAPRSDAHTSPTRDPDWSAEGVFVAHSVQEGIELAQGFEGDVMIGGGTQIYEAAMPYATHQVLTEVRGHPDGDTFYPCFDWHHWVETRREDRPELSWVWLERR